MNKNNEKNTSTPLSAGLLPKLRFPEFKNNGEWEEKLLNEVSSTIFDGTHQTPKYTTDGVPFFSVENIISGNKNKFISREDYLSATIKYKPENGDIIITRIGNIGTSKVIDWDYEFSIYVTLAIVKKSELFNSNYLHGYFQSIRYQNEIQSKSLLSAVPCKINMDELRNTKILLPPDKEKSEQQKIASCLSSLDDVIRTEKQKLDTLKDHKKGLLQNLFPQEGETVPKLRFKEFEGSGEWEEKMLGEFSDVSKLAGYEFTKHIVYEEKGNIIALRGLNIKNNRLDLTEVKYIDNSELSKLNRSKLFIDDLMFTYIGTIGEVALIDENDKYYLAPNVARIRANKDRVSAKFLLQYFNVSDFKEREITKYISSSSQPALTMENVRKFIIYLPSTAEQQKIASCLSSLDELITSQSQKIEALILHKKGLMQGLFPATNEVN